MLHLTASESLSLLPHMVVKSDIMCKSSKDISTEVTRNGQTKTIVAYGADNCIKLAANKFYAPPYKPSYKATKNADNFAFIAAGEQSPT